MTEDTFKLELDVRGVDPEAEELRRFRDEWAKCTAAENVIVSGNDQAHRLSSLQVLVINTFCGVETEFSRKQGTLLPSQVELEALFRGRQRALAAAFSRGELG